MPSPTTAGALITSSAKLIGAISVSGGEVLTADEFNDGLQALNDLLEILSTSNLAVYATSVSIYNTVPGQATYTIGPAGNWVGVRPVNIEDAFCTFNGVDFVIDIVGQMTYDGIGLKTQQQPIIEKLLYVNDNPLGLITLWPVPSQVVQIGLNYDRVLTNVTDVTTVMSYPPGYMLMMRYMLAVLMAPGYGVSVPPEIASVANKALADIKRANREPRRATFDGALVESGPTVWQTGV